MNCLDTASFVPTVVGGASGRCPRRESAKGEATVLSGRNRRIFLLFIVVLNIVVTVLSVQRGDMAMAILFAAAAVLILFQLIRLASRGDDDDDHAD